MVNKYPVVFFNISMIFSRLPLKDFNFMHTNRPKWILLPKLRDIKS